MQCSAQPSRTSCTVIEYLSKIFEYFSTNIFRTLLEIFELFFFKYQMSKSHHRGTGCAPGTVSGILQNNTCANQC